MLDDKIRQRIIDEMLIVEQTYASRIKFGSFLGVSASQISRVVNSRKTKDILSDAKLITIARLLNVPITNRVHLKTARTPVYDYIETQLTACQKQSFSSILVDDADIGKSYAAQCYCAVTANAAYIDCSQHKTKHELIRAISRSFGLDSYKKFCDVRADLIYFLGVTPDPLIVLDEAGDLNYPAFLELKALWNATEYKCGWYMMGADGLKAKIDRNKNLQKVGYTEIFSRFGGRYQRITPEAGEDRKKFMQAQVAIIGKANGITDVAGLYAKTGGSLRRIRIEIQKQKQPETA